MLHKVFISVLFLLCTSILFANEEAQQYFNNSKSIVFELDGNWNIAGNMKGIEIFIDQELENGNKRVITASKEEGLLLGISLSAYTASKIGLQLSVLEAQIVESDDIKVNGLNGKSIVYNYLNDAFYFKRIVFYRIIQFPNLVIIRIISQQILRH